MKACPALGQAAPTSRVTPSTVAPQDRQIRSDPILLPATPNVEVPANAEGLTVTISKLVVIDGYSALKPLVRAETVKVEGVKTTVAELYAIAARIEAIYAQKGYFLARAVVPAQRIEDGGIFTIKIVHGYIESLEINGLGPKSKKFVDRRLRRLIGDTDITYADVERRLLLAGDGPGLSLKSALVRGDKPGGVRLIVQGALDSVVVRSGFDNSVADGFSGVQLWTQAVFNNLLGQGEVIYGSAFNGPDLRELAGNDPERRVLGIGAIMPLGRAGLTLNPEFVAARIHPIERPGILITTGNFTKKSLKLSFPVVRSRAENLAVSGSFEAVDEDQIADEFAIPLSIDRLRIASLSVDWNVNLSNRLSFASRFGFSHGIDALGARNFRDVVATGIGFSRVGSRPDYAKINLDWRLRYLSSERIDFSLFYHFQKSLTGALPSYGQFRLDGDEGVSSFAPGTFSVDSGVTVRGEVGKRLASRKVDIVPYVFGAVANGQIANPTQLERADVLVGSYGFGARAILFRAKSGLSVQATLELSQGVSPNPTDPRNRVSFALSIGF